MLPKLLSKRCEHVIPKWLSKGPREGIPGIYQKSVVVDLGGTILRDVRHRFGELIAKCVCRDCNSDWIGLAFSSESETRDRLVMQFGGPVTQVYSTPELRAAKTLC